MLALDSLRMRKGPISFKVQGNDREALDSFHDAITSMSSRYRVDIAPTPGTTAPLNPKSVRISATNRAKK